MNEELTPKIINYLEKLEKNKISSPISSKKKNLLLASKKEYERLSQEQKDYQELSQEANKEECVFLLKEIKNLQEQKEQLVSKIREQIMAEEETNQNVVIEIRPHAGGKEAELFVGDLYRMYESFAKEKGWKVEMVETDVDKESGFRFISFLVKGENTFKWLKNEAGVHRVQRVPRTERKGRVHTSTASVVILPEAQDTTLNIREQDLKIETYSSGGPGGQHANKTASAVRVFHIPTKITATSQDGRDQRINLKRAMSVLKARILEKLQAEKAKELGNLRSSAIGTAERSEKIRTYNWPQNRITDHRLGISWNKLNFIIEGDLEELCQKLIDYEVEKKMNELN